jgi:hypothetical protein
MLPDKIPVVVQWALISSWIVEVYLKERPMGVAKNQQIEDEALHGQATDILVRAGVLKRCPVHEEITFYVSTDATPAYKLANSELTKQRADTAARKQMMDAIKAVNDEHGTDKCQICVNQRAKD